MNAPAQKDIYVRGGMLTALVVSVIGALLYGLLVPMIPFIYLKIIMLLGAFVIGLFLFSYIKSALPLRLLGAVITGLASVAALWFGWYWHEFGLDAAQQFILSGPDAIYKRLYTLSFQYIYAFGDSGSELDSGRWMTLTIWIGESIVVFAGPVLGALNKHLRPTSDVI